MKNNKLLNILAGIIFAFCLVALPASVYADDWGTYGAYIEDRTLPVVGGTGWGPSWFTAVDYFPDVDVRDAAAVMIENFEGEGRLIAATGNEILLQRTYGSDQWDVVANIVDNAGDPVLMDPSFIKVSPDGEKIALGVGYGKPLVIINTSALSISAPLEIDIDNESAPNVILFPEVNYYDAEWYDNQYLIIDGGDWPNETEPPYDPLLYSSGVGIVNTEYAGDRTAYEGWSLIDKAGASAGVGIDSGGNLYCGVGYGTDTGEIRIVKNGDYDPATPSSIDYSTLIELKDGDGVLSSAWLGVDAEDNVTVGGGNIYENYPDPPDPTDYGFAALINNSVAADLIAGTRTTPVDYIAGEWQEFQPDSCGNDSSTGIFFGSWGKGLAVMYNRVTDESGSGCAVTDNWNPGVTPYLKIYYPDSAPDEGDGDGIPNSADNAYLSANAGQQDTDGDGYGNICDGDLNNDGTVGGADYTAFRAAWGSSDPDADFNQDGTVRAQDYTILRDRWLDSAPYY